LAFVAASLPKDQRDIDELAGAAEHEGFAAQWLNHRGLDWAAILINQFPLTAIHKGDTP